MFIPQQPELFASDMATENHLQSTFTGTTTATTTGAGVTTTSLAMALSACASPNQKKRKREESTGLGEAVRASSLFHAPQMNTSFTERLPAPVSFYMEGAETREGGVELGAGLKGLDGSEGTFYGSSSFSSKHHLQNLHLQGTHSSHGSYHVYPSTSPFLPIPPPPTKRLRKRLPKPKWSHSKATSSPSSPSSALAPAQLPPEHQSVLSSASSSTASLNIQSCHRCHRRPVTKSALAAYVDCAACSRRTCAVCIRYCETDFHNDAQISAVGKLKSAGVLAGTSTVPSTVATRHMQQFGQHHHVTSSGGDDSSSGSGSSGSSNDRIICANCSEERDSGQVWCLQCLSFCALATSPPLPATFAIEPQLK